MAAPSAATSGNLRDAPPRRRARAGGGAPARPPPPPVARTPSGRPRCRLAASELSQCPLAVGSGPPRGGWGGARGGDGARRPPPRGCVVLRSVAQAAVAGGAQERRWRTPGSGAGPLGTAGPSPVTQTRCPAP
ncbi:transcription initiation factor TFIID subunit 4-like [Theropithecus gelada]|uniref:transcription initiation factor TFIID subunit 4-like n=1 Tax=Theropithecus gelada TaxID=9565 RepID=UPI000DC1B9A0|nr:transcription initiation factor TFIID subunit 4-like [Theropithecus gelada]